MRNIELKARLADYAAAQRVASAIATKRLGTQHQIDTYFHCHHGRLKLRQIDGLRAELVWYARADQEGPKPSDYQLVPLEQSRNAQGGARRGLGHPGGGREAAGNLPLSQRTHPFGRRVGAGPLPRVRGRAGAGDRRSGRPALLDSLMRHFAISPADLLANSYGEMVR